MITRLLAALALAVVIVVIAAAAIVFWVASRGISARAEPGAVETAIARTMRRLAIPREDRGRQNPVALTPDIMTAGLTHYADHCAACHASDGSGNTDIGRGLYPRPPDMRESSTQSLSDGELFSIIENGVRLTGMPAFGTGTAEDAEQTWHLVHVIRALPRLTPEQVAEIAAMMPRPPAQIRQEIEEQRFLEGGEPPAPPTPGSHVH
jgi:mono/diheme cytochrome c family protein